MKLLKKQKGFTLVELLVAIAIVAILAVVGLAVFSGLQARARDSRRRADVDAITRALEANYNESTGTYRNLAATFFASGTIPRDPLNNANTCQGSDCEYCVFSTVVGASPPATSAVACGDGEGSDPTNEEVTATQPADGSQAFIICTNLEEGNRSFCRSNQR